MTPKQFDTILDIIKMEKGNSSDELLCSFCLFYDKALGDGNIIAALEDEIRLNHDHDMLFQNRIEDYDGHEDEAKKLFVFNISKILSANHKNWNITSQKK